MWSIKILIPVCSLVLASCTFAQGTADNACPAKTGTFVKSVDIFDGPVADMAILMADEAQETQGFWNLGYVYEAGRTVNIRCKYADKSSADINLAKKINQCRYTISPDKSLLLDCK